MQPYAFPYIGYFQLIAHVDSWVVFDDTQYINKGWVNRNRILHPDVAKEWQYITIPVRKHDKDQKLLNIEINEDISWRESILGKLTHYKRKAPFYPVAVDFVKECLSFSTTNLSAWNVNSLNIACDRIGIPFTHQFFSELNIDVSRVSHAGQWALEIADALNAKVYVNPPGGHTIFDDSEFKGRGIELQFLRSALPEYSQRRGAFVPGLSIVDAMMWNEADMLRDMLREFQIVSQAQLQSESNAE